MVPVVGLVHSSAQSLMASNVTVPGAGWGLFSVVHKVHQTWRFYTKAKIYTNPNNFYKLVGGHVLNFTFGDNVLLRIAAQCILICNRIMKCVNQMVNLSDACHKWVDAVKGNYTHHRTMNKVSSLYEKTTEGCCASTFGAIIERIKRIAIATFHVFKCIFILSMRFMDAIDAFAMSPTVQNESINELFINGTNFVDNLVKNQQRLLDKIEDNHKLVSQILTGIGSPIKISQLISTLEKSLSVAETAQTVLNAGGGVMKKVGKNALFGAAAMVGMAHKLPTGWAPTDEDEQIFTIQPTAPQRSRPVSISMLNPNKALYAKKA